MKLLSIGQALQDARKTLLRFPFVIINAALGTASALILVDHEGPATATVLFKLLFASILGIPLLTTLALVAEKKKWGRPMALGGQVAGVLLLVAYSFSVPSDLASAPNIYLLRLLMLAAALHLFVAVAPFSGSGELNGFWHYNKTLFLRLLTAILYSHVLYVGLSIALAALDNLFGIDVPGKRYRELWVLINGLFATWFFLAGVPKNLDSLEALTAYPKGLKIFGQYILFPLALIYLVILYAYLAKILIEWGWPQGWVSKLILGFSGTGIFSLLLLYPITGREENVWIRTASRWFYVVLVPLVVMLFFAVWRRVSEYGFTEGRYLAIAMGVWLAGVIAYFILSKTKNIKVIPASLCVVSLVVSFGPWGAFAISEQSQVARLKGLLTKNAILVDGAIHKVHGAVPFEDTKQISSIISYLHDIHGFDGIQSWFQESLRQDFVRTGLAPKDPVLVAQIMGIEYVKVWQSAAGQMVLLNADKQGATDVSGYDRMLRAQHIASAVNRDFPGEGLNYSVGEKLDTVTFVLTRDGKLVDTVQINLRQVVDKLLKDFGSGNTERIPPEKIAASNAGNVLRVKMFLWHIQVQPRGGEAQPIAYDADIFYGMK